MQLVELVVPRALDACWRAFTDAMTLSAWVPGLRRARVITADASGQPTEILFEFGASRTYSLVYTYDLGARLVTWEPRSGKRDAVAGSAKFEAVPGGTRITYSLAQGEARSAAEKGLGEPAVLLASFARWVGEKRG